MMPKVRRVPERKCVACGERRPKKELARIVRTPEGEVDFDPTGKKSGRGAYICPTRECLEKAIKAKSLERALNTTIDESVVKKLEAQIGERREP